MAKRLLSRAIFNSNALSIKPTFCASTNVNSKKLHTNKVPTKEIKIPVQWGHIAAKVWGDDTNHRPILALHGWQDNAGTWDPLAPMLVQNRAIIAVDFPGHGLSSWLPPGTQYYSWDLVRQILMIKEYFKWDKISLMGHSMGSIASQRFASTFPDDVDFFVAVDILIYDDYDLDFVVDKYPKIFLKTYEAQCRLGQEPPSYTMDQIKQKWFLGTRKSVALESVPYLASRGTLPSKADPNKYYFSRDSRLKYVLFHPEDKKFTEALIRRLKCPTLFIKAVDSPYATDEFSMEMCSVIERSNPQFESQYVPGTHHVHLNNPETVAPLILDFFRKYNITH